MTSDRPNRNTILFLCPDEIKGLISMEEAVAAIKQGYREADEFPFGDAPRRRVHSPEGVRVSNFPGGIPGHGVIGSLTWAEVVSQEGENQSFPYREHPVYLLWDSETAKLDEIFEHAVKLDPNFVDAWCGITHIYHRGLIFGYFDDPNEAKVKFLDAARRAVTLDDTNAAAHYHLCFAYIWHRWLAEVVAEGEREILFTRS
jgi:hypothetical protein